MMANCEAEDRQRGEKEFCDAVAGQQLSGNSYRFTKEEDGECGVGEGPTTVTSHKILGRLYEWPEV